MDINKLLIKVLKNNSVKCSKKEEVSLDDPAFSQMDPHLKVDESEDILEEGPGFQDRQQKAVRKPPPFHAIFNNVKAITSKVEHIQGFKFEFTTPISQRFILNHSWVIPTQQKQSDEPSQKQMMGMKPPPTSNYTLSTNYVGGSTEDLMKNNPSYILQARIDSKGKLDASFIKFISKQWNFQFNSQFPQGSEVQAAQVNADLNYENDDSISTFKYTTGAVGFGHVQSVGSRLIVGFESIFGTMQKMTLMSWSGRYQFNKSHTFYCNYTSSQDQASLAHQLLVNKNCRIVSELNYRISEGTTQTIIGFRQKLKDSETIATISSKGKISTVLSLNGMGYSVKLCAIADYLKDSYKFGYGISLGGGPE